MLCPQLDCDGDGKLSLPEFRQMFEKMKQRKKSMP
jgi:hypothetical protein